MKKTKQLTFKKETIASLSDYEQNQFLGGDNVPPDSGFASCLNYTLIPPCLTVNACLTYDIGWTCV